MSVTIEECLDIAYSWNMDILSFRTTAGRDRLRASIEALVAQARDEEAEACALIVEDYVRMVDAQSALAAIRARIAARQQVEPECETCEEKGTIDERQTGWSDDNPKAKCPDCDGVGWIARAKCVRREQHGS